MNTSEVPGVRLQEEPPDGGPLVTVRAVRDADRLPVRLIIVTADLDPSLLRQVRTDCSDLEALLASQHAVLPLLDHGLDDRGRLFMVTGRPGPSLLDGPGHRPVADLLDAARALAVGLTSLADAGLITAPSEVYRQMWDAPILGMPLPPTVSRLAMSLGGGTGHESPEVLAGDAWTPAAQTYASASMLWTLLTGRLPIATTPGAWPEVTRTDVPDQAIAVLRSGLAQNPTERPADPASLAAAFTEAFPSAPQNSFAVAGRGKEAAPAPAGAATLPPVRPPNGGRRIDNYLLDEKIGHGTTGQVWAAHRIDDGTRVAVKLLRSEFVDDPEMVERLTREWAALKRLEHPNIVRVHRILSGDDHLGIVMELVDGTDLRRLAGRAPLTVREAATFLAQTADALAAVHAIGFMHRDVKPANILVGTRDGRRAAILTDFGTARSVRGAEHTQLIGTPAYFAPELAAGRPPGPAADVYALGIMAYELFAGAPPFSGTSPDALMRAHLDQPPTPLRNVDDDVWTLVAECLDKREEARPRATDAARRWRAIADPLAPITRPNPPERPTPAGPDELAAMEPGTVLSARPLPVRPLPTEPRNRRRAWVIGAASGVLVLGVAAGTAIQALGGKGPGPIPTAARPTPVTSYYPISASVVMTGAGKARIRWQVPSAAALPGLSGYIVSDTTSGNVPLTRRLASDQTSFTDFSLKPGRRRCYSVFAVVTAAPKAPLVPSTCVVPPEH